MNETGAEHCPARNDVGRESSSHGARWGAMHGGYFSDPSVAAPLIGMIREGIERTDPEVLVDLGGGTGYLLSELARTGLPSRIRLIVLEASPDQLGAIAESRINGVLGSIPSFVRLDLADEDRRFMFITRSTLHYAGEEGLDAWLGHLRSQMRAGECFTHQTACFESEEDSLCLNALYEMLQTRKWYPTAARLTRSLGDAGFRTVSVSPAPVLTLTSESLASRYGIETRRMEGMRKDLAARFGRNERALRILPRGFEADLHYTIVVNVAV